jgi:hypothetical protein
MSDSWHTGYYVVRVKYERFKTLLRPLPAILESVDCSAAPAAPAGDEQQDKATPEKIWADARLAQLP